MSRERLYHDSYPNGVVHTVTPETEKSFVKRGWRRAKIKPSGFWAWLNKLRGKL